MQKKLKLGKLEISSEEVIDRSQLSNIFGGSGSGGSGENGWCYLIGSGNSHIDTLDSFHPDLSQSQIRQYAASMCLNLQPTCERSECTFQ
jgi:hypothetical protein